jgi:hypothetical protein
MALEDSQLDLLVTLIVNLVPAEADDVGAVFEESAFDESMLR